MVSTVIISRKGLVQRDIEMGSKSGVDQGGDIESGSQVS